MTDIDTIREALECSKKQFSVLGYTEAASDVSSALAALERVSALKAEMEAALRSVAGRAKAECEAVLKKLEESR